MIRTRSLPRIALQGLFAVWLAAVAVAPLWHSGHTASPIAPGADGTPRHEHASGAWLCNAAPETVDPAIDCVLCKVQRQLSQFWTRIPDTSVTIQAAAAPVRPALIVLSAGEYIPLAARAPPFC